MISAVRSELTRLAQPRLLIVWFGLMAMFAAMVNTIMVSFVSGGGDLPPGAPGVAFPSLAEMESVTIPNMLEAAARPDMRPDGLSSSAIVGNATPGAPGGRLPPPLEYVIMIVLIITANRVMRPNQVTRRRGWRRRVSSLRTAANITPPSR